MCVVCACIIVCAMDWCPIPGAFSRFVSSVAGSGSRSAVTLNEWINSFIHFGNEITGKKKKKTAIT